jgi:hypothetical protein
VGRVGAWSPRISYARTPQTRTCPLALLILHHRRPSCSRSSTHAHYLRVDPRLLHFDRHSGPSPVAYKTVWPFTARSLLDRPVQGLTSNFETLVAFLESVPLPDYSHDPISSTWQGLVVLTAFIPSRTLENNFLAPILATHRLLGIVTTTSCVLLRQDDPLRAFVSPQSCSKPMSSSTQITAISNLPTQSTTTYL